MENCNLTLLSLVSTKPEISVREMSNVHVEESQGHVSENTFRHQDSRSLHDINQAKQEDNKGGQTDGSKVQEGDKVAKEGESSPNQPGTSSLSHLGRSTLSIMQFMWFYSSHRHQS